jgi:predicted dienelactone hydrolase
VRHPARGPEPAANSIAGFLSQPPSELVEENPNPSFVTELVSQAAKSGWPTRSWYPSSPATRSRWRSVSRLRPAPQRRVPRPISLLAGGETLADAGFIVAAINHPGDNSTAMSRTDELSVLIERPADIKRLTDYMLGTWPEAATIDPARVGLFGFSRGGYTGLVVIGGNPDFRAGLTYMCPPGSLMLKCQQIRENKVPPQPLVHDLRVKAAVLADPGCPFMFNRGGLKNVTIPVQLWRSERGGDGLVPEAVIALVPRFPKRPQYHVPAKSAHFSFLAPCLPEAMKAFPELCIDPPGFDRATFHKAFNAEVLAFFRQNLVKRSKP